MKSVIFKYIVLLASCAQSSWASPTLVTGSAPFLVTGSAPKQRNGPVCILGAGPSGLAAARRLNEKGYKDIVIFEKTGAPGGKATDWISPNGQRYFMGPVIGTDAIYVNSISLLKEFGVPYVNTVSEKFYYYNFETGVIVDASTVPTDPAPITAAAAIYIGKRKSYESYLVPNYKNGIPAELTVSLRDWLVSNNMEALSGLFYLGITGFGYGSLADIPTIYALTYIDQTTLGYFLGTYPAFTTDFNVLFTKLAANVTADIRYNADVYKVQRKGASVDLQYRIPSNKDKNNKEKEKDTKKSQKCSKLIVAFPPRADALAAFDLDTKESDVFSHVVTEQYFTSIVDLPKSDYGLHANFLQLTGQVNPPIQFGEPKGLGQPILYYRQQPGGSYAVIYSWKRGVDPISVNTVNNVTLDVMSRLNRDAASDVSASTPLTAADLKVSYSWPYFPHVRSEVLANKFYERFNALQGNQNTFWTSGLNCFETVEYALRSAYSIVDTYF